MRKIVHCLIVILILSLCDAYASTQCPYSLYTIELYGSLCQGIPTKFRSTSTKLYDGSTRLSSYDKVVANTFTTMPIMEVNTLLFSSVHGDTEDADSRGIRSPQRAPAEGDEKPSGYADPMPIGDLPVWIILLLALAYSVRIALRKESILN